MKKAADQKLDFSDVLIRPRLTTLVSRRDANINRLFTFRHSSQKYECFPLVASNMDVTGTFAMAKALAKHGALTALSKYHSSEHLKRFYRSRESDKSFYSMGMGDADLDKLRALQQRVPIPKLSVEVANGYMREFATFVSLIRRENSDAIILAGSVCTPEGTIALLKAGADIVRVGIGSGSVCITRKITGVGYPQLSAVLECAQAAHQESGLICSDGGCTVPGDICKAFGAGADFVMLGGMLAGHKECAGKIKYEHKAGKKIPVAMQFYGMASSVALQKHFQGDISYRTFEGKAVDVPYRGPVSRTILDISGGLRSMMTYVDAKNISELADQTTFISVQRQLNTVFGS